MASKERKAQDAAQDAASGERGSSLPEDERARASGMVDLCQRILHALTGVMIGAFALIVLFTTFSTGGFVQVTGRGLYFLILAAAVISFGTWVLRVRAEKRLGKDTHVVSDTLRRM
ncbi:MAG: hypothetical protein O2782_18970 [bacterium]|nr:hypothetical protein [bacterium]